MKVALIGCSKRKLDHPAPARDLYQGLLFRLSVRYIEEVLKIPWLVLSVKYGVVEPDQIIEPYSLTLTKHPGALIGEGEEVQLSGTQALLWAVRVNRELKRRHPRDSFICLLSRPYMKSIIELPHEWPFEGMRLGPRIVWLQQQLGERDVST